MYKINGHKCIIGKFIGTEFHKPHEYAKFIQYNNTKNNIKLRVYI